MGEIMILISTKYSQDATKDTWKTPGKHSFFLSGFHLNSRQYLNSTNRTKKVF